MEVVPKLFIGTFPGRVIGSTSSPIPENIWYNSNSDCCGDKVLESSTLGSQMLHRLSHAVCLVLLANQEKPED